MTQYRSALLSRSNYVKQCLDSRLIVQAEQQVVWKGLYQNNQLTYE